jgi:hypothetical protein
MFDQLQESDISILVSTERELNRFDENLKQLKKNKKNYN